MHYMYGITFIVISASVSGSASGTTATMPTMEGTAR
jgi:hypothetical protein